MKRRVECMFCAQSFPNAREHLLHLAQHTDRQGRSRRPWSCWACAHENSPTTTTCAACGWEQIRTPAMRDSS